MKRMLSLTDALTNRYYFRRGFSATSVNICLWSYYRKDVNAHERLMFEKMVVLQQTFGSGKYFDYDRKRLSDELGMGKDAVRTAIHKLQRKGLLSVREYAKKGVQSYSYLVNFQQIARNVGLMFDREKIDNENKVEVDTFDRVLPAYFIYLDSGNKDGYNPVLKRRYKSSGVSVLSAEESKKYKRIISGNPPDKDNDLGI